MKHRLLAFVPCFFLVVGATRAQAPAFDQNRWQLVKRTSVVLTPNATRCDVLLLKSVKTTASSGVGEPLFDVDLIVRQGGRVLYDYAEQRAGSGQNDAPYYIDDHLEVRDVTGDNIPEVLFHSGTVGASDSVTNEHILQYGQSTQSVKDISRDVFYNSGTHGLRWLTQPEGPLVVIADRNWPASVPLLDRCHYCASPFQYDLYGWSARQRAFVVRRRVYGSKSYEQAGEALAGDWDLIQQPKR